MRNNATIKIRIRYILLFFLFSGWSFHLGAQKKAPFIFRKQEQKVSKRILHYLHYDTIIQTSKAKIHLNYSNDPDKPFLLLLHGMGVDGKTNWYRQIPQLSKHFNLVIPDLIYFGKSSTTETNYSVEFQAQQIHEVIQLLKFPKKINLMGFSYGGLAVAVYNELFHPEIDKLIIIDGPVKFFSAEIADSLATVCGVPSMTNVIIPQSLKDYSAMEKAVLSKKYPATRNIKMKLINHYFTPGLKTRQLQLNYIMKHQLTYQTYNYNLDKTRTLLVWGAKDGVVPVAVGEKLHAYFPNTTKLLILKKAKHDGHFRYSKKLNKAVVKFLMN